VVALAKRPTRPPSRVRSVGVLRVSPNDLRRTCATWMKQEGVDSAVVAKLLGHTSSRMVYLVYGQLANETLARAVADLPAAPARAAKRAKAVRSAVPRGGIEPPTRGFSVRCSTCWATWACALRGP